MSKHETYEIIIKDGEPEAIKCLICNRTSYNINDVKYKFCGNCNQYHNILKMEEYEMQN